MIGNRKYGLPSASKKKASVEEQRPIESAEPQYEQDEAFDDQGDFHDNIIQGDYVEEPIAYEEEYQDNDDYYFEEQEEPNKSAKGFNEPISSSQPITTQDHRFDALEKALGDDGVLEEIEVDSTKERNARDESEPFVSPPGYVWRDVEGTRIPFQSLNFLMNLIGIGDAGERFRKRPEAEEDEIAGKVMPLFSPFADSQKIGEKMEEQRSREKYTKLYRAQQEKERKKEEEEEEQAEEKDSPNFKLSDVGISPELESKPPGWMFWHGARWDHWWHGYEEPTSWFFGYPAQWLYRIVHLAAPETYETFKYKPEYGQMDWQYMPFKFWHGAWWFFTHPCVGQIIFNCILITPFAAIPQLSKRLKILRYRMQLKRTVLDSYWDHLPLIWRRFRWRNFRRKRKRMRRWVVLITFILATNCWDLFGRKYDMPTADFWETNYIKKFVGVQTDAGDLEKIRKPTPMETMRPAAFSVPNKEAMRAHITEQENLKKLRSKRREDVFGSIDQQEAEWSAIREEENQAREEQLSRANATLQLKKSASTVKL
jgi:hypothetical protein